MATIFFTEGEGSHFSHDKCQASLDKARRSVPRWVSHELEELSHWATEGTVVIEGFLIGQYQPDDIREVEAEADGDEHARKESRGGCRIGSSSIPPVAFRTT